MADFIMKTIFPAMLKLSENVVKIFTYTLANFVQDVFNLDLPLGALGDFSLIGVIFGGGLVAFIGFTLVKWIIGIVT